MDRPSVDRRSRDGVKLDYSTSIRPEEPRWRCMMRSWSMGFLITFLVIHVLLLARMTFLLLKSLSAVLVFGLLYYLFRFRKELLWRLLGEFRAWHARACVDIFNFKNACDTFVKKLSIWMTDRRNEELKYFKWTCVSPHILSKSELICCGA